MHLAISSNFVDKSLAFASNSNWSSLLFSEPVLGSNSGEVGGLPMPPVASSHCRAADVGHKPMTQMMTMLEG